MKISLKDIEHNNTYYIKLVKGQAGVWSFMSVKRLLKELLCYFLAWLLWSEFFFVFFFIVHLKKNHILTSVISMWAKQEIGLYYYFLYLEPKVMMIILPIVLLPSLWFLVSLASPQCSRYCVGVSLSSEVDSVSSWRRFLSVFGLCFLFPRLPLHFVSSRSITLLSRNSQGSRLLRIPLVFSSLQRNSKC